MPEPAIELRHVWKVFGSIAEPEFERLRREGGNKGDIQERLGCVVAVADASFSIAPGEIFCIMACPAAASPPCCATSTVWWRPPRRGAGRRHRYRGALRCRAA